MIRKLITVIGTAGILGAGALIVLAMGALRPEIQQQEPQTLPPTVFYAIAEAEDVSLDVTAQGEVRPRTDISLTSQVSGRVVDISKVFVNGGAVEEGELLIKIEDADYRAAAAMAKSRLAQAEETLRMEEAESALARQDYEELGRDEDPTNLALRLPQLAQTRAAFEAAEAEYQAALLDLERTEIKAPFKGRVRERMAGLGQFASAGSQLGQIFATDIAEVRLALTDSDLQKLGLPIAFSESPDNPGPPVTLTATIAGEAHQWQGRIARTEGAIDPATRQVFAIAVVDDPYGAGDDDGTPLVMGLFVDARIKGKPLENAIILPSSALYGHNTVYVIGEDNRLEERTVSVVSTGHDAVTIAGGVSPGERVTISPLRGARSGDPVTPVDPSDIPSSESTAPDVTASAEIRPARAGAVP